MHDLSIIIVSTNEARWLRTCLSSVFAHAGECKLDVVVADNASTDGTRDLVENEFPQARVIACANHGFGHANNRALMTTSSRYVLFLNPDTEIVEGSFAELVRMLDARPGVGLVGVKQLAGDGELYPTIRHFPNVLRALGQGLLSERFPVRPRLLFERELDLAQYEREVECDWTSGRSCSAAARPCRGLDSWTSDSSSTARSPISAAASSRRDGRCGTYPR